MLFVSPTIVFFCLFAGLRNLKVQNAQPGSFGRGVVFNGNGGMLPTRIASEACWGFFGESAREGERGGGLVGIGSVSGFVSSKWRRFIAIRSGDCPDPKSETGGCYSNSAQKPLTSLLWLLLSFLAREREKEGDREEERPSVVDIL